MQVLALKEKVNVNGLLNVVQIHIKQKKYFDAYLIILNVLKQMPSNETALRYQSILYKELETKKNNIKWNPKKCLGILLNAEKLIEAQQYIEAKYDLTKILNIEPKNSNALNDLAVVNILEKNYEYAKQLINIVLENEPSNEVALGNLNYILTQSDHVHLIESNQR